MWGYEWGRVSLIGAACFSWPALPVPACRVPDAFPRCFLENREATPRAAGLPVHCGCEDGAAGRGGAHGLLPRRVSEGHPEMFWVLARAAVGSHMWPLTTRRVAPARNELNVSLQQTSDLNVRGHAWLAAATLDPAASERRGEERGGTSLCSVVPWAALVTALAALWRLRKDGGWDLAQAGLILLTPLALGTIRRVGVGERSCLISNRMITLGHLQTLDIPGPHCPAVSSRDPGPTI